MREYGYSLDDNNLAIRKVIDKLCDEIAMSGNFHTHCCAAVMCSRAQDT